MTEAQAAQNKKKRDGIDKSPQGFEKRFRLFAERNCLALSETETEIAVDISGPYATELKSICYRRNCKFRVNTENNRTILVCDKAPEKKIAMESPG